MIDTVSIVQAIRIILFLLPVLIYSGIAFSMASSVGCLKEWLVCFIPNDLDTVGEVLFWLLLFLFHLSLTPGALVFYCVRGILRIKIRKDNE